MPAWKIIFFANSTMPVRIPRPELARPNIPKELGGPAGVIQQEFNADQVEQDSGRARQPVVRLAVLPQNVLDWDFGYPRSRPACQRGYESVVIAVKPEIVEDLAAVRFECGAKIIDVNSRKPGHDPVCNSASS
jgi:hypothetical protein